tara:strand:+ start:939 stop:3533 length:2595 start_codon:yes stop_codon:yes gene_type:complete
MTAVKIHKFLGTAPKVSSELLPDGAGQIAYNAQLYSGDLIPYSEPAVIDSVPRLGTLKTLHGIRDPDTNALEWLTWLADVDIAVVSDSSDAEQRLYYTGDGAAKVTTFSLATTGSEPYPVSTGYYDLGLDLPTATLVSAATSFASATSATRSRDAGNTAILVAGAAHNLRTGMIVTITGMTNTTFNVVNTRITVTNSTTFEYYSAGAVVASGSDTGGTVTLAGNTITRDYTYTWYTPWGEESIAATPSTTLFIKEGQLTTLTGIPTTGPSGRNAVSAMRVYRTLTGSAGTEFYLLSTLWFPQTTARVELTSNVASVTMATDHGFSVGDRFKLTGCTDTVFNKTDGIVTAVPSVTKFSYAVTNANIADKGDTTGKLLHDASEVPATDSAEYWGDTSNKTTHRTRTTNVATLTTAAAHGLSTGHVVTIASVGGSDYNEAAASITVTSTTAFTYANTGSNEGSTADTAGTIANYSFVDDFDYLNLVTILATDDYDAPDPAMVGITEAQNSVIVGFFSNQLCFAEPGKPHAWPIKYRRTIEHDIVAIAAVAGYLVVLTEQYAYRVAGSDPATMNIARIDNLYPCLSKRSVVGMGYGVMYATYGGLALWAPRPGLVLATKYIHDWDTWDDDIDPSTVVGQYFNDKYFGSYTGGSFIFERDEKVGGYYIDAGHQFHSAWLDPSNNALYTASDSLGNITQWGSSTWPLRPMEWKSKTIVLKDYINVGAARVIADYSITAEDSVAYSTFNASVATYNTALWADSQQLGSLNGPTDYTDTSGVEINNFGEFNRTVVHGDGLTRTQRTAPTSYSLHFKLWQNKTLVQERIITDDEIFRCPSGYKSDTFEVSVASEARVRSIHLGETPDGLRKVG